MKRYIKPRVLGICGYFAYLCGGLAFLFLPLSNTVAENASFSNLVLWHIFLTGGAALSFVGALRRNIVAEASGIPLIISALIVYIVLVITNSPAPSGARYGFGCVLLGGIIGLLAQIGNAWDRVRIEADMKERGA